MSETQNLFESAWLKWSWAVAHSHELDAHMKQRRADPQADKKVVLGGHYDAKRHCIDVFVKAISPLPIEWGLVLGDIAHNYRGCVDHIAWALVCRGRTPPDTLSNRARRKIFFPVWETRTQFNKELPNMLPGIRVATVLSFAGTSRTRSENGVAPITHSPSSTGSPTMTSTVPFNQPRSPRAELSTGSARRLIAPSRGFRPAKSCGSHCRTAHTSYRSTFDAPDRIPTFNSRPLFERSQPSRASS